MAATEKITWDAVGEHYYETGVKNGVLYVQGDDGKYQAGVAWNGLTAVTESPSGAEFTPLYADDIKYLNLQSIEEFGATIEAYTYPDEFCQCDGSASLATGVIIGQQARKTFGLSYRTSVGNDIDGSDFGYKLHIIYGARATPSEKAYATINDSPEAITFSWELNTTPVNVTDWKPTASLTIDSTKVDDDVKMADFEAILYGVDADDYDTTQTYGVGDYVIHTENTVDKVYRCNTASTTGVWNAEKWDEVTSQVGPRLPLPDEIASFFA